MGRPPNLRSFLQKEVRRESSHQANQSLANEKPRGQPKAEKGSTVILDTDSLFGDPIISEESKFEKRIQDFLSLASPPHMRNPESSAYIPTNVAIENLKHELKNAVYCLKNANTRGIRLIRRQKAALVEEIKRLEGVASAIKKKERKGMLLQFCKGP